MKPNLLITTMLATTALFVVSCSTPKMAQNKAVQDDVYNTTAKAKEYIAPIVIQPATTDNTDDYYSNSDPYYDMDYSSRIDRFYYGNQNRPYYDPSYNYYGYNSFGFDPYGYNSFYRPYNYGFGLSGYFGNYYNNWNNPYYSWGYYGSMHYNNFWGPYSYYDRYGWGGGGWNGGGWGGGVIVRNNENYRPRPNRSSEGMVRPGGRYNGSTPSRGNVNTATGRLTRAENYNPSTNRPDRSSNTSGSSRPTRTTESRPAPTRESYSPPARSSSPPASSSGSGSSNSGSGSSRPTRGGGRG